MSVGSQILTFQSNMVT